MADRKTGFIAALRRVCSPFPSPGTERCPVPIDSNQTALKRFINIEPGNMDIQHKTGDSKGAFTYEKDGKVLAELTYSKAGDSKIIADHTEVTEELRGQNVGRTLVEHMVRFAREHNLEVIPLCPYVKSMIRRDTSLQDVVKEP